MSDENLMTIEEVAKFLEIKTVTVKRYAREGLLDSSSSSEPMLFERIKVERFKDIQSRLR
ncbi:MAG: DNA-binding protein [Thalassolituus sp.]|jgi:DNA-binding transcriptional MerR regulator|uniref:Helix-turn-helix domain-containing protein n=1 Tax=Thalassolituus maritimus TaxID=484498 RepID=A0ABP9ZZ47_9GAMM|nr:helix-turn-helix domain-containing protein [Pseudomonadota bacterium]MEC8102239.1 helix-turn-helix domain-containing protein [Pseudomonadota bacterium]MEC8522950.1 helix-turn-helix domain-containing protein [Pseudomonadota bacterium]TNC84680.1 MAG: DNA-binding protein [Thalassolituus sp.]|tara:strand:+ start:172 stop:351 length:180 start_codon:yes stop_codon:yes gene_type:complete